MAARASQSVQLIFHDVGLDDWQFSDLMTQGAGVVARQGLAATATSRGFARDGLANLLRGDQQTLVLRMARLTAAFLAGLVWGRRRATFAVKAVRRGGQGGIAGIGPQLGASVGQLLLDLLNVVFLLLEDAFEVFDFDLEFADGGFQFLDTSLRLGGF
jgi:hypothetical protein